MAKANGIEVNKGDIINVSVQGIKVTGKVVSVDHWGNDGWYIEMDEANVPGGYSYWKQGYDGGVITHVNGKEVEDKEIPIRRY